MSRATVASYVLFGTKKQDGVVGVPALVLKTRDENDKVNLLIHDYDKDFRETSVPFSAQLAVGSWSTLGTAAAQPAAKASEAKDVPGQEPAAEPAAEDVEAPAEETKKGMFGKKK